MRLVAIRSKRKTYFKNEPRRIGPANVIVEPVYAKRYVGIPLKYFLKSVDLCEPSGNISVNKYLRHDLRVFPVLLGRVQYDF